MPNDLVKDSCEICGQPVFAYQGINGMSGNHFDCKIKVPLTKQNKAEFEEKLTHIFGGVKLLCDGYEVAIRVEPSKMKLFINTYVNGYFKGIWCLPKEGDNHPERKFLRQKTIHLYPKAKKEKLIKTFGKKRAYETFKLDEARVMYLPDWPSGKAALSHLMKVCDSVEVYVEG